MSKRYDPNQPRIPAGSSKGGQWAKRESAEKIYNTVYPNDINATARMQRKIIPLSRYVNSSDKLHRYAKNIIPIDGYEDMVIHGDQYGFELRDLNDEIASQYTPEEFAEILRNDPNYHGGNIRLISCSTGRGNDCAAQKLANELGVNVISPTDTVWVFEDGDMVVGETEFENTGTWLLFKPKGR